MTTTGLPNFDHLTRMDHARARVNEKIEKHIKAGTLEPAVLAEARDAYFEEVKDLDVPGRMHDSLNIQLALLGDCSDEAIEYYLAIDGMPKAEQRRQAREELQAMIDQARERGEVE